MIHVNKHTISSRAGFTLIELMLAMAFVSVLLLAIALTIIQVGNIYSKGMALKDINQSARTINEDLRRTIAAAGSVSLEDDSYVVQSLADGTPVSGRLCLGGYSYVWNTVDASGSSQDSIKVSPTDDTLVTLVRVPDPSRIYCAKNTSNVLAVRGSIRAEDVPKVTTLLARGDHSLAITSFSIKSSATAQDNTTGQRLFSIAYGIGTGDPSTMEADRMSCRPPSDAASDSVFCNVQGFEVVVRSGEGV